MGSLNYVDFLLILFILLNVVRGWQRGFLLGVISLAGWVSSLMLAIIFTEPLAGWVADRTGWSNVWDRPVAFLLITFGVGLLFTLVANVLLRRIPSEMHSSTGNRILGILPGTVNGLIFAAVIATLLLVLPVSNNLHQHGRDSLLADRLASQTDHFRATLVPIFGDAIAQALPVVTIHPAADERVALPFTETAAPPRADLERQLLDLLNHERISAGLAPLEPDPLLTQVARAHSADMLARGYFGHTSPDGVGPFERISSANIPYRIAGENLALAPTLRLAHTGLMNSPGHRANILHTKFGRIGIGILDAGPRGLMVTQLFRN